MDLVKRLVFVVGILLSVWAGKFTSGLILDSIARVYSNPPEGAVYLVFGSLILIPIMGSILSYYIAFGKGVKK